MSSSLVEQIIITDSAVHVWKMMTISVEECLSIDAILFIKL